MSTGISKKLLKLNDFLLSDLVSDDAMQLSEIDGFLAGIIVCPDLIMPSEWMPLIWGEEAPVFESMDQLHTINDLIMGHYNDIIRQLDQGKYSPIYVTDMDNTILWEFWIEGFWSSEILRPQAWIALSSDDEEDTRHAVFSLARLYEIISSPSLEPTELDEGLENIAHYFIPLSVETLHRARLAQADINPASANERTTKVGRNNPCPCGSGKKFKKCCLN